jgi:hypothetical protein
MGAIQVYPDELDWVNATLAGHPGSFLDLFCKCALAADAFNYELLRPVVAKVMQKYPANELRLLMERHDNNRRRPGDLDRIRELWNKRFGAQWTGESLP